MVTTTELLPGYRIARVMGPVIGISARTRSPYSEGLKSLEDGHGVDAAHRLEALMQHRVEAVEHMLAQASRIGANAVVGMRFDHRAVTESWNEICAYGTALIVVAEAGPNIPAGRPASTAVGSVS
jgi:uncharacterized protein YbjQ (UPF0145 family)